jgi:radical SAM protein with 4Fe4S-binding SPASM domain
MEIILKDFRQEKYRGTFISAVAQQEIYKINQKLISILRDDESKEKRNLRNEILVNGRVRYSADVNTNIDDKFTLSEQEYLWLLRNDEASWIQYLQYRVLFRKAQSIENRPSFPCYVLIEPTSICNLRCPMCFQVDKTFTKKKFMGMMSLDLFKSVADECYDEGLHAITLASRGEPLLHPNIIEMIRYLSYPKFFDVKINTNATRLTPDIIRAILESGISEIVFSVDSGDKAQYEEIRLNARFEEVFENVKMFNQIRESEYPGARTISRISGVQLSDKQSSELMVSRWSSIVDSITVKPASPRWDSYNNPIIKSKSVCSLLSERMYVWWDGTVNPCDFDYKSELSPGNAGQESLRSLWNGKVYNRIIDNHKRKQRHQELPCDRCPY